jgi:NAD(P)H-dependent FMN reductase
MEAFNRLGAMDDIHTSLLDVREKALPLLESIYRTHPAPTDNMHHWKKELDQADAILIVSPEHNSSYSGALKNSLDYFFEEYSGKPMGIITVSAGALGGVNAAMALQHFCLKVGGYLMPAFLITPKVQTLFDETGNLTDESYSSRLDKFLHQFVDFSKKFG